MHYKLLVSRFLYMCSKRNKSENDLQPMESGLVTSARYLMSASYQYQHLIQILDRK